MENIKQKSVPSQKNLSWLPGDKLQVLASVSVALACILLAILAHWKPSGESWGYWLFARIFAQTGKFIVIDRSPLYILYLNLFRWMGFPFSWISENIITSLFTVTTLILFFRRYTRSLLWSTFAVILWIPFLHVSDPPVQKLALAFSCIAIMLRDSGPNRFRMLSSYAVFLCAYMIRGTYLVFIVSFALFDITTILRRNNIKEILRMMRPQKCDWPIAVTLFALTLFSCLQSPHPWNNVFFASDTWSPTKGKSFKNGAFIHNYNWQYIGRKYGTFDNHDYFITNKELFNGADNMIDAIKANPKFVLLQLIRNTQRTFILTAKSTIFKNIFFTVVPSTGLYWYLHLSVSFSLVCLILHGAFHVCKNANMFIFLLVNVFLLAIATISLPKARYLHPLIPIFVLSAFWYGNKVHNKIDSLINSSGSPKKLLSLTKYLVIPGLLVCFSNGSSGWSKFAGIIASDCTDNDIKVFRKSLYYDAGSLRHLESLIQDSKGILSLEHNFFAAFTNKPVSSFYDIWEIPPFGHFDESSPRELREDRIDCVLVSKTLATSVGFGTNVKLRYKNYIEPYIDKLISDGAKVYTLEGYGKVVVLEKVDQ